MRSIHSSSITAVSLFAFSLVAGCGLENGVVGGRCAAGMVLIEDTCVGKAPPITLITPSDPPSGSFSSGTPATSGEGEGKPASGSIAGSEIVVAGTTPPPLVCETSFVACRGECIAVANDPRNCGACNKQCPSNICVDGECQGTTPGDVVLIGHDYTNARAASAQAKVLVNALTIPTTEPIRVLSYEDGATNGAVSQAKVVAAAGLIGRTVAFQRAASPSNLASATLSRSFDVVLIHGASGGDAAALGASWSSSLGTFASKGGVVVAIDNGTSPIPQLLSSSGLLAVTSHAPLPNATHLVVTSAQDTVGVQLLSPYAGFGASVGFQGIPSPSDDLTWIVRAKNGAGELADPVVVHRIVR
jgi:hypothetical protein